MSILVPDTSSWQDVIIRLVQAVVDTSQDDHQPGDDGEELVYPNSSCIITVPLDEWINCGKDDQHSKTGEASQ